MAAWLATFGMGAASLWVAVATDFVERAPSGDGVALLTALLGIFLAITVGYSTVGAVLTGRGSAGRIGALMLAGGVLFALIPFGFVVGGHLAAHAPGSALFAAIFLLGPVALGPGYAAVLPVIAIAFPDGNLPSARWRRPVVALTALVTAGMVVQLVLPGPIAGGPVDGPRNPFGIAGLPPGIGSLSQVAVVAGILGFTVLGIASVIGRYRRGDAIARQQQRWFMAAVSLAAVPLALSTVPGVGGPEMALVAAVGLTLVPIAVGVAVTRYRLYEIDHLINRTLVYVPLTALLAGLYAATVTLLQRVFQSITGDRSDAAIIITTLILASVFTPIRKWLEGIVDRRFKPTGAPHAGMLPDATVDDPSFEERVEAIALRVVRTELEARRP